MFSYEITRVVVNRDPDNPTGTPLSVILGIQILDEEVQAKGVQPLYNEYTITRSQLESRPVGQGNDGDFYRSIIDPQARDAHGRWAKANENPPPRPIELTGVSAAAALGLPARVEVESHADLNTAPVDVPAYARLSPDDEALKTARELLSAAPPADKDTDAGKGGPE